MKNIKFLIVLFFVTLLSVCVFNEPKYINLKVNPTYIIIQMKFMKN